MSGQFANRQGRGGADETAQSTSESSTHTDWAPGRVDLLTEAEIAQFFSITASIMRTTILMDPSFPRGRVGDDGESRWRLPDVQEWYEGQRNA